MWYNDADMKIKAVELIVVMLLGAVMRVYAAPVSLDAARGVGETLVRGRVVAGQWLARGEVQAAGVRPLMSGAVTAGYVVSMAPAGFVLVRADDTLPAWKLMSETCGFEDLPPGFVEVMKREMEEELGWLDGGEWTGMDDMDGMDGVNAVSATAAGPLLTLNWNQDYPYNMYAPVASGGPGGRAYAGCVAAAMAMIMRHHQWPAAIARDYSYRDSAGSCTGTHAASAATLAPYQWSNMPNSISWASPLAQRQAIGQLMYHCGVTVRMDYEADGSGAYSESVPGALQDFFLYNVGGLRNRSSYNNAQWYALIETDILANRPLYYSFISGSSGHAVVCDGCRNGNEIHLNFGWGGYATAWYNMDNVNGGGYTWTQHRAINGIAPQTVELAVIQVAVQGEDDGDGYVAPGETAGVRVWVKNTSGLAAQTPQVKMESATGWMSVQEPAVQSYPALAGGAVASNASLFAVKVMPECPAGLQSVRIVMVNDGRMWTNMASIRVDRLPRLVMMTSNVTALAEGESTVVAVSNTGMADLVISMTELAAYGTSGYQWTSSAMSNGPAFVWQDISRVGMPVTISDNDGMSGMVEMGFGFPFYGKNYRRMSVGANGGIGLTNGTLFYRNRALPATTMNAPAVFLAPLWSDLEPVTGGTVRWYSDSVQSIVTWEDVPVYGMNTAVTVQVIMRRNGEIVYQYKQAAGLVTNTVGVQGGPAPAGPALQIAYNEAFVRDGLAVRITPEERGRGLQIEPGVQTVAPGSVGTIKVTCAPAGLEGGEHTITAVLQHNDPRVPPGVLEMTAIVPEPAHAAWWWGVLSVLRWATRRYDCQGEYTWR